jgi:transposase-like protein
MPRQERALSKQELEQLYCEEGLTIVAIAGRKSLAFETVRRSLHEYGIHVRPRGRLREPGAAKAGEAE